MATKARVRRSHVLPLVLGLALAASAADAQGAEPSNDVRIASAVKAGDTVAVTRWSGGKVKGQVVEVTACSLLVRAAGKAVDIPAATIKTLRRYPPEKQAPGARAVLDVVADCQHVGCAPETVALVGVAALFKSFGDRRRGPEIVYRGGRGRPTAPACAEAAPVSRR